MIEKKKKILIFSLVYLPRFVGGAEIAIKEITDKLGEDFEFDMITLRIHKNSPRFERVGNINVYRVGVAWKFSLSFNKYSPFAAFFKAVSLMRKNKYDAMWSVLASYNSFTALFVKFFFKQTPWLLTLQEGDPIEYINRRARPVWPVFKMIFTKSDRVQAISHYLADFARSMGARNVSVVPNGVDVALFSKTDEEKIANWREKIGKKAGDIFIITASRLVEKNGIEDLIYSLLYLPENIKLAIAGVGHLEIKLLDIIKLKKLEDRVVFLGLVPHSELPSLIKACDFFCRPSLSEGFGNSFVEAMAAEIPVIATPVGGIVDFLVDKKTGFMAEVKNPESIAREVNYILANKNETAQIVEQASQMVKEKYDWDIVAREMSEVFNSLIK